jgi:hypothetical protein
MLGALSFLSAASASSAGVTHVLARGLELGRVGALYGKRAVYSEQRR